MEDIHAEMEENFVDLTPNLMRLDNITFKDKNNNLVINTSVVLGEGSHNCGTSLIMPSTPHDTNAIAVEAEKGNRAALERLAQLSDGLGGVGATSTPTDTAELVAVEGDPCDGAAF